MPIYEYFCTIHGHFEVVKISWKDKQEHEICPSKVLENKLTDQPVNYSLDNGLSICGRLSVNIPSLVAVQPDNFWSGRYEERLNKYFTSKSDYRDYLQNPERNGHGVIEEVSSKEDLKRPTAEETAEVNAKARDAARMKCLNEALRERKI